MPHFSTGYLRTIRPTLTEDITRVITYGANSMGIGVQPDAAQVLAEHSRGTPRIALKLLGLCRDCITVEGTSAITQEVVYKALDLAQIAPLGLDSGDLAMLHALVTRYEGKPVGIRTIAACMGMKDTVIETVHEPYLTRLGLIDITPKGRMATFQGMQYVAQVMTA